jgi:hypothetical protein
MALLNRLWPHSSLGVPIYAIPASCECLLGLVWFDFDWLSGIARLLMDGQHDKLEHFVLLVRDFLGLHNFDPVLSSFDQSWFVGANEVDGAPMFHPGNVALPVQMKKALSLLCWMF